VGVLRALDTGLRGVVVGTTAGVGVPPGVRFVVVAAVRVGVPVVVGERHGVVAVAVGGDDGAVSVVCEARFKEVPSFGD